MPPRAESPRKRFALTGTTNRLDRRIYAVRDDIADIRLADLVFAPHYVAPLLMRASAPAAILTDPENPASALSEILPGEGFEVFDRTSTHGWGQCCADGSVGHVALAALEAGVPEAEPAVTAADPAAAAATLIGAPFKQGGRTPAGIDAGGLLFTAFRTAGQRLARFADLQACTGTVIEADDALRRGDLIFFAEGAAIATSATMAIQTAPETGVANVAIDALPATITARRRPA